MDNHLGHLREQEQVQTIYFEDVCRKIFFFSKIQILKALSVYIQMNVENVNKKNRKKLNFWPLMKTDK